MNNCHLKYSLSLIICFLGISAFAQKDIKGRVTDFLTFSPIENASIYIKKTTVGTVSNADGKFVLSVPRGSEKDTLVISSIGYKSFKTVISDFDPSNDIALEEETASLDEVILIADKRPKTGNDIVLRAIEELPNNLPEQPYLQKGFLRHRERNKKEYKWLIEAAITVYDSSFASGARKNLKINVDEIRKSYDLRDVDSLFAYSAYLKYHSHKDNIKSNSLRRDTIKTASLIKAIRWNDERINGLDNFFKGKLNLVRNANVERALFGNRVLENHQFDLDTVLVDNGRKLYKIKISKGKDYVGLNTPNIFNEGFEPGGWIYIYWDNYAIKKIEYELIASSDAQKKRSKSLFDTYLNHKLIITYREYNDRMYPNYIYYETPKLVNAGDRSTDKTTKEDELQKLKDEQFYYTVQEILFTEIITDPDSIYEAQQNTWVSDIFSPRPYNASFWKNYNVLLESEEEGKLILDLSKRATLFKQ